MTHRQRLYLRTTIVLLLFPFDRPLLRWLHARSLRRSESLWLALYPVEIVAAVTARKSELEPRRARLKQLAAERQERDFQAKEKRDADEKKKQALRPLYQTPLNMAGSTLVVNSPLILCPICSQGALKVDTRPIVGHLQAHLAARIVVI